MKLRLLYSTLLLVFPLLANAQKAPELPAKCEAFQPTVIKNNILLKESDAEKLSKTEWGQRDKTTDRKYWTVYSDRDNNPTYTAPDGKTKCGTLAFNEQLRIAVIKSGYALVYSEPKISETYPKISSAAESRGWVPMSKLLLWESCLTNDRGIYNKALLCINLDNVKKDVSSIGKGYLSPDDKTKTVSLTTDMNFYFIMKKEKGMALLASQYKIDGSLTDKVLYCWVPEASYVPWNQRSCAEPTWDHEDVKYFSDKKTTIKIFKDKAMGGSPISSIKFKWNNSQKYDQYEYRMNPFELRYPILDDGTKVIYNLSTFSTIGGTTTIGDQAKKSNEQIITERQKKVLEDMQNINLGIVIDGTTSMGEFYPAVKEAIKEGCKYFSKNYKIKVGVVIYRDYPDGDKGLVEVFPMADPKNNTKLDAFLDKGGEYGVKSSKNDKSNTEALYYGINTALDRFSFKPDQSNILLVVGDCGNAANDTKGPSASELTKKMIAKKVNVMGFQVINKNDPDWNSFNNQLQDLMKNSLKGQYDALNAKLNVRVTGKQYLNDSKKLNGYDFSGSGDLDLFICSHRFADANVNGGKMNVSSLESYLESSIGTFAATIQKKIDEVAKQDTKEIEKVLREVSGFSGGSDKGSTMSVSEEFIREKFKDLGLSINTAANSVINFRGYANKVDASSRDFFKPVLFISNEEFQELLKRLAPVNEAASVRTNDREPYINAMKALVRSLAPGLSDAEMSSMGNGEIMNMIAGLNEAASALNEYTLNDLSNQAVVSQSQYLKILTDFTRSFKNLQSIKNSKTYKFVKEFNGAKYYWIPIEDLP